MPEEERSELEREVMYLVEALEIYGRRGSWEFKEMRSFYDPTEYDLVAVKHSPWSIAQEALRKIK